MSDVFAEVVSLLRRLGAAEIEHPGGDLLGHLQRVEQRLHAHGSGVALRLAGLAHAVYGTDGFDRQLLGLDDRSTLVDVVGEEAEHLVYLYAACDRERTWRPLSAERSVHDRWTGKTVKPPGELLASFVDLTTVNELDVAENARGFTDEDAAGLLDLIRSWEGLGSPQVTSDGYRTLAR